MKRALTLASILAVAAAANASGFTNGSFEDGVDPGSFTTLNPGDTNISGWSVGGTSVDYIGSYWLASDGARSLDLGGLGAGSVSQTFDTVNGQQYLLTFDMAGNPDNNDPLFTLNASVGDLNQDFSFINPFNNDPHSNMGWQGRSALFTATGASSTITFTSLVPPGAYGPALDNVQMQAVPEPCSMIALGLGAVGLLRRKRV